VTDPDRAPRPSRRSGDVAGGPRNGEPIGYAEALAAIAARGRFGIRLGLGRTRALLRELGDPQRAVRGALVGGTNGKGSVLALAAAAIRAAGLRVGETPKPHLVTYRERLQVDGRPVDAETFAVLAGEVLPIAARIARRHGEPTEFELLTAMMFRWFAEMRPDVALVEVGLGGRLDATHVWDGGVAVVTNVGLDHMDRLGSTIVAIAREKAAIIERGDHAVTAATGEALTIVRRRARRLGVPLVEVPAPEILGWDRDGIDVELPRLGRTRVGLRGRHQAVNAATAHALLDALGTAGIAHIDDPARRRGFADARWPGRLELIEHDGREILLDGAHNPAGASALAIAIDDLRPYLAGGGDASPPALTVLSAAMADKDVAGIVAALSASAALVGATVICTQLDAPRALPAAELARTWRAHGPEMTRIRVEPDLDGGWARALGQVRGTRGSRARSGGPPEGPVLVTGSLYLVGAIRARLVDDAALRDPEA